MRWLLDSNTIISAIAGLASAGRALHQATTCEWCGYSAITRLEVFSFPRLTAGEEQALNALLEQFIEVPIDSAVITEAIRIRRLGKMRTPDAIIGACARLNNAELVTRNIKDFSRVPGLTVIDLATL
jgi:predicted nucleic acid-binding protein